MLPARGSLFAIVACAVLSTAGCAPTEQSSSSAPPAPGTNAFLNQSPDVGYIGRESCRPCHLGKASTYALTGMGRSFYPMTPEQVVEDFVDDNELALDSDVHYRMYERDGKFFQRQFVRDVEGRERAVLEHELVWAIGSTHHNRAYVTVQEGKLFQAPVCWYPQGPRWALCPGFEHQNDHFFREVSDSCVFCHNGVMTLVEGERNRFEEPLPHGIGCERCHGPGELHSERWAKENESAQGDPDPTIVNPRRMSPARRNQICFQCHLGDAAATERVLRTNRDPREFRPGDLLLEVTVPFRYVQSTRHDFGLSSQADRMLLSACYQRSEGRLECLTCHDPHVSVYDRSRPVDLVRRRCLGCHEPEDCSAPVGERQTTEPADDCVQCHMRTAEPDDQRFTSFTDHWIRRRIDDETHDPRQLWEVEPFFPKELASLPAAEQAYYQARARFLMANEAPPLRREALWDTAAERFREAIDAGYDTADAWFFLGKTLLGLRRGNEAVEALALAVDRDPTHHDATFALGQAYLALNELDGARRLFGVLLDRNPDDPMALAELGRLRFEQRDVEGAIASYARAVELMPWDASLRKNYGTTLAAAGRIDDAVVEAEAAVRIDPDHPGMWEFFVEVMRAAGRDHDREFGASRLELLRSGGPAGARGHG